MTFRKPLYIRAPADLGSVIRERRRALGLGQADLARAIGASRQWVIGVERGRARAELGLVLRALDELGLRLTASLPDTRGSDTPDIDAIIASSRTKKR